MITTYAQAKRAKDTLPNTLGGLIRVGLKHLYKIERMKEAYSVNMWAWHVANSHCSVCLGGGVMALGLEVDPKLSISPSRFNDSVRRKLTALDYLRGGYIADAAYYLGRKKLRDKVFAAGFYRSVVEKYERDSNGFKANMRRLARRLEAAGF